MVKFYVRQIIVNFTMTLDQVPLRWREAVRKAIEGK